MTKEQKRLWLKDVRQHAGKTQVEFAEILGFSASAITAMERGEREITRRTEILVKAFF